MQKIVSKIQFPLVLGLVLGVPISRQLMDIFGLRNWKFFNKFAPDYFWIWWQTAIYVFVYFFIVLCVTSFIRTVRMSQKE